jgi:hypothetical protein
VLALVLGSVFTSIKPSEEEERKRLLVFSFKSCPNKFKNAFNFLPSFSATPYARRPFAHLYPEFSFPEFLPLQYQ